MKLVAHSWLYSLLLATAAALGCAGSSRGHGSTGGADGGAPCPVCQPDQVCYNGGCYDTSCEGQQCPPNAVCSNGSCVATSCLGVVCPAGYLCAQGGCQSTACGATLCPPNEVCSSNSCVPTDCFGVECPSGFLCAQGACESTSCGSTPCPPGDVCSNGSCVEVSCVGLTCPADSLCTSGGCYPTACSDRTCQTGEVCSPQDQCESTSCATVSCDAGALCAAGDCVSTSCGSTPCPNGLVCGGSGCVTPDCYGVACPSGFLCGGGACQPTACGATACPAGQVCGDGACVEAACYGVTCETGWVCASGACYPQDCPNQVCPAGDICSPDFQCESASCAGLDCAAGTLCAAGSCLPTSCGATPCGPGQVCDDAVCVEAACVGVTCTSGESCANGACYVSTGCPAGEVNLGGGCILISCAEVICPSDLCTDLGCTGLTCVGAGCHPIPQADAGAPPITAALNQVSNNRAFSAVNWPGNQHVEVFVVTHSTSNTGRAYHAWTNGNTDIWHSAVEFSGYADCGPAAVVSLAGGTHAELFTPNTKGQIQSLYFQGTWHPFEAFGGTGITDLTTLRWPDDGSGGWNDGRAEAFGLDTKTHRINHKFFDPLTGHWLGWSVVGAAGSPAFATGASAILADTGLAYLFAVDDRGHAWYTVSLAPTGDGWTSWKPLSGGTLSSRPVVVRDNKNVLRIFGRGTHGALYGARSTTAGFSPLQSINPSFTLAGEPSAVIDHGDVEVFVRGLSNRFSVTTLNATTERFSAFAHWSTQTFLSDPFAWQRDNGSAEVFGVDTNKNFVAAHHSSSSHWTNWTTLGGSMTPCVATPLVPSCPAGDGTYCGGHGVGGTEGVLYDCNGGTLSVAQTCGSGCQSIGNGGSDVCGCNTNADCGQCSVCLRQADICGGGFGSANSCTTDLDTTIGLACGANVDCDPCGSSDGGIVCAPCSALLSSCSGSCCQYGS